jgi:hypothetical protein
MAGSFQKQAEAGSFYIYPTNKADFLPVRRCAGAGLFVYNGEV